MARAELFERITGHKPGTLPRSNPPAPRARAVERARVELVGFRAGPAGPAPGAMPRGLPAPRGGGRCGCAHNPAEGPPVPVPVARRAAAGLGVDLRRERLSVRELARGIGVEGEHGGTVRQRARIALDHLRERPDYYRRLERCMPQDNPAKPPRVLPGQLGLFGGAPVPPGTPVPPLVRALLEGPAKVPVSAPAVSAAVAAALEQAARVASEVDPERRVALHQALDAMVTKLPRPELDVYITHAKARGLIPAERSGMPPTWDERVWQAMDAARLARSMSDPASQRYYQRRVEMLAAEMTPAERARWSELAVGQARAGVAEVRAAVAEQERKAKRAAAGPRRRKRYQLWELRPALGASGLTWLRMGPREFFTDAQKAEQRAKRLATVRRGAFLVSDVQRDDWVPYLARYVRKGTRGAVEVSYPYVRALELPDEPAPAVVTRGKKAKAGAV